MLNHLTALHKAYKQEAMKPLMALQQLHSMLRKSEPLAKAGYNRLQSMFALNSPEVVKWVSANIKHEPLQIWYLKNHKANPEIHNDKNMQAAMHYDAMYGHSKEISSVPIEKMSLEDGIKALKEKEDNWASKQSKYVPAAGKKIVDFGNGIAWYDLEQPTCEEEKGPMGHCANTGNPHEDDRYLSLRKEVKIGNNTMYEPMLTFINNEGWLGEMKAKNNKKPSEKLHPYIAELLKKPEFKGAIGAGWEPEHNFSMGDMTPEMKQTIKQANPNFVDMTDPEETIERKKAVKQILQSPSLFKEVLQGFKSRLTLMAIWPVFFNKLKQDDKTLRP